MRKIAIAILLLSSPAMAETLSDTSKGGTLSGSANIGYPPGQPSGSANTGLADTIGQPVTNGNSAPAPQGAGVTPPPQTGGVMPPSQTNGAPVGVSSPAGGQVPLTNGAAGASVVK